MFDGNLFILAFTGVWCLVGAIFLAIGVGLGRVSANREERLRVRATGTVVEMARRGSGAWYPIIEFEAEGRRLSLEYDQGGGPKRFYKGQSVEVLYDPDDPSRFTLEGIDPLRLLGRIFRFAGLGCVAIGIVAALLVGGLLHSNLLTR